MLHRNVVLEGQHLTGYHQQGLYHRETGEDRTRYEIGREDRRMPSGNDRGSEVEGYNRVYRKYERGTQTGQYQGEGLMTLPVLGGTSPAKSGHAVKMFSPFCFSPVT